MKCKIHPKMKAKIDDYKKRKAKSAWKQHRAGWWVNCKTGDMIVRGLIWWWLIGDNRVPHHFKSLKTAQKEAL